MVDELRMAELLCTRLCHDLTGPIGAVNNGAEFLSEEGFNLQGQAVELIVSSAFSAVTRLQFYRMAYGQMRDHGEASLADKQKLASDFFTGSKITLDWPESHTDAAGVSISLKMSRLIFNLLIVASGALIRGGTIGVRIMQEGGSQRQLVVTAQGPGMKWDDEIDKVFSKNFGSDDLTPRNVQTYLTRRFCEELGASFNYQLDGEQVNIQVTQQGTNP
jgi:histidine phosphotransferase ChpT